MDSFNQYSILHFEIYILVFFLFYKGLLCGQLHVIVMTFAIILTVKITLEIRDLCSREGIVLYGKVNKNN